ncbi:hypothetical protein QZH41_013324 [Actinostola sp. cb2023]|nr:hypothetical protein QZH41_013324 [Actinostola sp. cb2023]
MPFGVKNAPAVFSRLMADVMRGLTWNGVAIYLDDIIIGGASFDEHLRLLKEVLSRLRNAGLTIKSSKVHLCQKTLRFLGHLVSVEDKGLEFDSSAMLVLATELGIDKKRISALHPQANGAVERLNRTIGQMLKKTQEENDLDWDLKIPFVRFNYLNQEHSSTGYSPFYLTFGRNPRTPVLVKDSSMPKPKTPQQWATDLAKTLKEAHDVSSTRDRLQKEKRAEKSKEVLTTQRFKVGDEVLVYSPTRKGQVKSLHRAWAGPYIVIQCREGNTYRIKNSDNFRQRFIRHHDQLRYLHSRPLHLTKPSQADVTDDKPVHDIQPSGVPKKPTTSTNTVPPSTSLPTFGDSDDESDEDSDNGEGELQEKNGEAPGGSTEPETARRSHAKTKAGVPTLWRVGPF